MPMHRFSIVKRKEWFVQQIGQRTAQFIVVFFKCGVILALIIAYHAAVNLQRCIAYGHEFSVQTKSKQMLIYVELWLSVILIVCLTWIHLWDARLFRHWTWWPPLDPKMPMRMPMGRHSPAPQRCPAAAIAIFSRRWVATPPLPAPPHDFASHRWPPRSVLAPWIVCASLECASGRKEMSRLLWRTKQTKCISIRSDLQHEDSLFIFTCQNGATFPLFSHATAGRAIFREWRLELECVHVMVLLKEILSCFQFVFAEIWRHMGHLNVCQFCIQRVGVDLIICEFFVFIFNENNS